jgi:hypothetical protein
MHRSACPPAARATSKDRLRPRPYTCADGPAVPGSPPCSGLAPSGQPINTKTVGQRDFTVTATLKDGRGTSWTVTYSVTSPSNRFTISRVKPQRNGTISLQVKVPGPGVVNASERATATTHAKSMATRQRPQVFALVSQRKTAGKALTLKFKVPANARGRRLIGQRLYTIAVKLSVTFTPRGGARRTVTRTTRLPR